MAEQIEIKDKDSIVFYRGWFEAISLYPIETQNKLYNMVFEYGFDGVIPNKKDGLEIIAMYNMVKPIIDSNYKKWVGSFKGGRPKKEDDDNLTGDHILDTETLKKVEAIKRMSGK